LTESVIVCSTVGSRSVFEKSGAQVKAREGRTPSTSVDWPSSVTVKIGEVSSRPELTYIAEPVNLNVAPALPSEFWLIATLEVHFVGKK